jgi:hypothetical protein
MILQSINDRQGALNIERFFIILEIGKLKGEIL